MSGTNVQLRALMQERGLTNPQVAKLLGIDPEEAQGYAYHTDGFGTIQDRVKSYFSK